VADDPAQIEALWAACDNQPIGRGHVKLTRAFIVEFCKQVRRGNFLRVAANRLGVSEQTCWQWRSDGRRELAEYEAGRRDTVSLRVLFLVEGDRASSDLHDRLIVDVLSSDDPKLKFEFMRRRWGKIYSANPNATEDPETGEEHTIDAVSLLLERIEALKGDGSAT